MWRMLVLSVLVCVGHLDLAHGAKKSQASGGRSEAIAKAQELILSNQRSDAIRVLVEALSKETRDSKSTKELKKTLVNLSEMFLTTKGQQLYEVARSSQERDLSVAIDKLQEALLLEPANEKVRVELARSFLTKGECGQVLEMAKDVLLLNPYSVDFFLLRLQSKVCTNAIEDFEAELMNPYIDTEEVAVFVDILRAQYFISKDKLVSGIEALNRAKVKEATFPEIYYWLSVANSKLGSSTLGDLEKYVGLCKELQGKIPTKYRREPRTCSEFKAMQKKLESLRAEAAEAK